MYDIKALYEAKSTANAVELLLQHPEAVIIAGGSDVLIKIRDGKLAGKELVSIYGLDELRGVELDGEENIRIGSLTSFSHIHKDPLIKKHIAVLGEAVNMVGGPQIRAIGTIGGNTCNGVTSADSASTLFAWDAIIEITGPDGIRCVPIEEFYLGPGKVDLRPGEIQTHIIIPKASWSGYKGSYIKYGMRNAMEIATTGCSVNVKLTRDKQTLKDVRIAYGVAGPIPLRAKSTEEKVRGRAVNRETADLIGELVLGDVNPRDSWRAAKDFRLHLCQTMAVRAFEEAVARAGGEISG